jgi:hypothetical protein
MKSSIAAGVRGFAVSMALVLLALSAGAQPEGGRIARSETIRLYPAPRQHGSFSLYFDITPASPGLISIGIEVLGMEPGNAPAGMLLGLSLRRKRSEMELRHADFGPEGGTFSYGIDAYELEKSGCEYRVVVSNWSTGQTVSARLVILYPGDCERGGEEEKVIVLPRASFCPS